MLSPFYVDSNLLFSIASRKAKAGSSSLSSLYIFLVQAHMLAKNSCLKIYIYKAGGKALEKKIVTCIFAGYFCGRRGSFNV